MQIQSGFRRAALSCLLPLIALNLHTAHAGSATWNANPANSDWNTATNWTPNTVPNGASDVATFATSSKTAVSISAPIEVSSIVYNPGASAFTITVAHDSALAISGPGVVNNSGITQQLVADQGDNTSAPGNLTFTNSAAAGDATLVANAGTSGGVISFSQNSLGGTTRCELFGTGSLALRQRSSPGITIGSLEGDGLVFLGARNLTVGSNDLTTTFSGVIQDGGAGGGTGGSLTKLGRGYLTLASANTYTGGTIVSDGKLTVNNTTGSGTGTGPVQDPGGNLTGNGIIAGAVTVGGVHRTIAVLAPGSRQVATFTIQGSLTFAISGNYDWSYAGNLRNVRFDQVLADGVVIKERTGFNFFPRGTLRVGTVLTVINNTSASPIAGTFSNLADGAIIVTNGGKFQADYEGGDGNDLTLTVVP